MSSLLLIRRSRRNYFQPATRTLFYVWIVTLGIPAEIPILFLRLDIYRRLLLDDRGCFRIVWIIVRIVRRTPPPLPPSTPSRPDPDTSMPVTSAMVFTSAMRAAPTVRGPPNNRIPGYGACKKKYQNNKDKTNGIFHFHLLMCGCFFVPSSTIMKILIFLSLSYYNRHLKQSKGYKKTGLSYLSFSKRYHR
jgi:hypothetical protein